ncbi:hypothetical protein [Sodalis sp. RH19]|uniref:hypothetical protein n=1 Tax=Sodalis sp. RH19 TaxID=3394334 RepID=UPI0039B63D21
MAIREINFNEDLYCVLNEMLIQSNQNGAILTYDDLVNMCLGEGLQSLQKAGMLGFNDVGSNNNE